MPDKGLILSYLMQSTPFLRKLVAQSIGRWLILLPVCFGIGCANVVPPDGGPRDETPPMLDTLLSTPNFQTNFAKQRIDLTFDEWVKLEDVTNQVVVSPPLEKNPTITIKKRTVRLEFDEEEVLKDSATYVINFGEAVKDLTENNPVPNLRFVFSTGAQIDSIQISGTVKKVEDQQPLEKVLVMLYENTADSVVRKLRPYYFAKTDKAGRFQVSNMKPGRYKVFALEDTGRRYVWDGEEERIGFLDTLLQVDSTLTDSIRLQVFLPEKKLRRTDAQTRRYGSIRLQYSRPIDTLAVSYDSLFTGTLLPEYAGDSLIIWFRQEDMLRNWQLYLQADSTYLDTLRIQPRDSSDLRLRWINAAAPGRPVSVRPDEAYQLQFNHLLTAVDTASIVLLEDTLLQVVAPVISWSGRQLSVAYDWKEGLPYRLQILPGTITDWFGLSNDTLLADIRPGARKNFGLLKIQVDSLQAEEAYIFQLKQGEKTVYEHPVTGTSQWSNTYPLLPAGDYVLEIVYDRNKNKRWDTGNYDLYLQPERRYQKKLETLRANWDLGVKEILPK